MCSGSEVSEVKSGVTMNSSADATMTPWYWKSSYDYIDDWFLMGTPFPVIAIWIGYMALVLKLGPALMEKRPAFQLRTALLVYNILQVLYALYIFMIGLKILTEYGLWSFNKCILDSKIAARTITEATHIYLMAKVPELLDTVFFVLRKKWNQITFLHVYHHSLMMLSTWATLKWDPSYSIIFLGTINSGVHVIMYSYYGLSAFPRLKKYLWWKKYLTSFQLLQFLLIAIQVAVETYVTRCRPSFLLLFIIFFNLGLMIYLFSDFYFKSYVKTENVNNFVKPRTNNIAAKIKLADGILHRSTVVKDRT